MNKQWIKLVNYLQHNDYTFDLHVQGISIRLEIWDDKVEEIQLTIFNNAEHNFEMRGMKFNKAKYIQIWLEK